MNTLKYAEEFTQLVIKWTKSNANGKDEVPLTNQQLLTTTQDVLRVLLRVNLQICDYSTVKTPVAAIEISTPAAPTVPKVIVENNGDSLSRFPSLNNLSSGGLKNSDIPGSVSRSQDQMDARIPESESLEEKKYISRSSPAINVSSVSRSDTFVRGETDKEGNDDVFKKDDLFFLGDGEKTGNSVLLKKIEILRKSVYQVMTHVDDIKKDVYPQTTKNIRRLSSFGGYPSLTRSSTTLRPVTSSKIRKSSSGFPVTPTSSKPNAISAKDDVSGRRKTIGVPVKPDVDKKSPVNPAKPGKNPKYAHVQSSIPKSSIVKRKAQ